MESRTLLFGGSGFFGPIILERYPEIISVGRTKPPVNVKNEHIQMDNIKNLSVLNDVDFDKVIFLIGNSNHHEINKGNNPLMGLEYNVIPLQTTLHYLRTEKIKKNKKIKKFIAFTGALLYDPKRITLPVDEKQPIDPYRDYYIFSKYMAEETTKVFPEIPTINVRLSNIYGPTRLIRPDIVQSLMQQVLSSNEAEIWNTKPQRDFIYAKDAADAVVALLDTDYVGHINLGTGKMRSIRELKEIIEQLSGKKIKSKEIDVSGPMMFQYDISLIKKITGWKPKYSLEDGLRETYNEMKSYAHECCWGKRY